MGNGVFTSLARAIHRRPGRVFIWVGASLAIAVASLAWGGKLSTGVISGTESQKAEQLAGSAQAAASDLTLAVLFHSDTLRAGTKPFAAALEPTLDRTKALPSVDGVVSTLNAPISLRKRLTAKTGHDVLALVRLKGDVRTATHAFPRVRAALDSGTLQSTVTGKVAFVDALNQLLEHDLLFAELISLPLALLVLLWVFRTAVAALLPLAVGGLAVLCGVAFVLLLSHATDMARYTLNVVSLIGLGVAIDYSLFIVSRFRAEQRDGHSVEEALSRTLDTAGRAVAFSGLAVSVGMAGLLFYRGSYLSAMGLGGAIVVALSVVYALTFLPALLVWLGPRLEKGRVPLPRWGERVGLWHDLATWVMRHPTWVLIPTLAVLVAIALPFHRLQLAATDITALPKWTEARKGEERLQKLFPEQAATRILVTVAFPDGEAFTPKRIPLLYAFSRKLMALKGVEGVESIVNLRPGMDESDYENLASTPEIMRPPEFDLAEAAYLSGRVTVMQVLTSAPASSAAARDLVRRIRANRKVGDATVWVGGQTASDVDATHFIAAHTPWAVGFVVGAMCLILFALLGSVVLPIKAMVMNFLSLGGSFGALVWIFQEGHLQHLLRFHPGPIEPALPVLLFCTLFGLSMDYEVLMLSRMREEWLRTGDPTFAVAEGLERTGGLITSAAAIMVAVFAAFSLATVVVVKAMGVGMAIAVALDATLVRVLIVPATMRLFGRLNWWAPAPLAKMFSWSHAPRTRPKGLAP